MGRARLFTAVELPPEARGVLAGILEKGKDFSRDIKWVSPDQTHITLVFLGEQPESLIEPMRSCFAPVGSSAAPFPLELGGWGAFPKLDHSHVLFVKVIQGTENLSALASGIAIRVEGLGITIEKGPFHAHVTLGRVKRDGDPRPAVKMLQDLCPAKFGLGRVGRFSLFRSRLTSEGPLYDRLGEFPLGDKAS